MKVSGCLETDIGGPSSDLEDVGMHRRTLYGKVSRKELALLLRLFDYPEATRHCAERNVTTTPLQQLYFMNSPFIRARPATIVEGLLPSPRPFKERSIRAVFRQVLAPDPSHEEIVMARKLLASGGELEDQDRWSMLAQALLVSNEFLFVD